MALSGQLSDLSLAELIEFFCNQRKTGRLRVSYPRAPGFFYFQNGTIVDARIGALSGVDAVYYALTLANASFNFDAEFEPSRRTIHQPWAQVALEGLRRMDEGIPPGEAFPDGYQETYSDDDDRSPKQIAAIESSSQQLLPEVQYVRKPNSRVEFPLAFAVAHATKGGHSKMIYGGIAGAVLLSIVAVGYPAGWYRRRQMPVPTQPVSVSTVEQPLSNNAGNTSTETAPPSDTDISGGSAEAPAVGPVNNSAVLAARREREARERERWNSVNESTNDATAKPGATPTASTIPVDTAKKPEPAKPKTTTVQVTYDEAGRVTQASGGDANALRIARQKRFPPGKAGTATVTIPVN